jgi:hypothetical protein
MHGKDLVPLPLPSQVALPPFKLWFIC